MGTTPDMGAPTAMTEPDPVPDPSPDPAVDPSPPPADPDTGDATVAEIAALAAELGITPGQLKGRLEASRKWEQRAKKADEDAEAARLASLDDLQRAQEEARTASERAAKAERRAVALEHGLPAEFADRLVGSTPEELAEDAERLKGFMAPAAPPSPQTPAGSADGGPQGTPAPQPDDIDSLLAKATADGDWKEVVRLNGLKLAATSGVAIT